VKEKSGEWKFARALQDDREQGGPKGVFPVVRDGERARGAGK